MYSERFSVPYSFYASFEIMQCDVAITFSLLLQTSFLLLNLSLYKIASISDVWASYQIPCFRSTQVNVIRF